MWLRESKGRGESEEVVERVHEFLYLGSLVGDSHSLGVFEDVQRRVNEATKSSDA